MGSYVALSLSLSHTPLFVSFVVRFFSCTFSLLLRSKERRNIPQRSDHQPPPPQKHCSAGMRSKCEWLRLHTTQGAPRLYSNDAHTHACSAVPSSWTGTMDTVACVCVCLCVGVVEAFEDSRFGFNDANGDPNSNSIHLYTACHIQANEQTNPSQ